LLISVLTPTYNREKKLYRVFESIKKQTLKKIDGKYFFEWVIVDDGSSDNTKGLVEKWQKEVDWPIKYIYQENRGKAFALSRGLREINSEWTLIADSDDEFKEDTFETFVNVINNFTKEEREKCGGISVLCEYQDGKRVGCDYPIENKLIPTKDIYFKWRNIPLGETWALLKTKNLKKVFLDIPKEAKNLKFIPESFFWDRIVFEIEPLYSYPINKVLRVYYKEDDNISHNIRKKYPDSFLFESKYFITHYWKYFFYMPKAYVKHLIKFFYFRIFN